MKQLQIKKSVTKSQFSAKNNNNKSDINNIVTKNLDSDDNNEKVDVIDNNKILAKNEKSIKQRQKSKYFIQKK